MNVPFVIDVWMARHPILHAEGLKDDIFHLDFFYYLEISISIR